MIDTQRITVHVEMGPAAGQIAENCLFDLDVSIRDTEELCHHALYNWDSLIRLQLPDNLKTIGQSALEGCTSLKEVTIPKSVSAIGQDAFLGAISCTCGYIETALRRSTRRIVEFRIRMLMRKTA